MKTIIWILEIIQKIFWLPYIHHGFDYPTGVSNTKSCRAWGVMTALHWGHSRELGTHVGFPAHVLETQQFDSSLRLRKVFGRKL